MAIPESDEARCLYSGIVRAANSAISMSREDALDEPLHVRVVGTGPVEAIARRADTKIVVRLSRVVSKKSIVLSWAVLKWSVQSNRYGDLSISGCRSIPRSIVHQQSRLECSEFRCKPSMGHHISRSIPVKGRSGPAETFPPMHFAFVACMLRLGTDQCIVQTLVVALAVVMRHETRTGGPAMGRVTWVACSNMAAA